MKFCLDFLNVKINLGIKNNRGGGVFFLKNVCSFLKMSFNSQVGKGMLKKKGEDKKTVEVSDSTLILHHYLKQQH